MPTSQHSALLLLALAVGAAASVEPVEPCEEEGTCRINDPASLMQVKRQEAASQPSCLEGSSMPTGVPGVNGGKPALCPKGGGCCPLFGYTYPCPSLSPAEQRHAGCVLDAPPGGLFPPHLQPKPVAPPASEFDGYAYGPPVIPGHLPGAAGFAKFLREVPGVHDVKILHKTCPKYKAAFYPDVAEKDGYSFLWGDLGSEVNPGFGGVRTYDAVEVIPNRHTGLYLYHMALTCSQCDIWWGFHSSYSVPFVDASINVQTCLPWTGLLRCHFTEPFLAVIGQGWDRDANGFDTMGCDKTQLPASTLVKDHYPGAPPDAMQIILPGCDVAAKCEAIELPAPEKLNDPAQVPNLAALFETEPVHPPRREKCLGGENGGGIGTEAGISHR